MQVDLLLKPLQTIVCYIYIKGRQREHFQTHCDNYSAYHLCPVHVLCVCMLFVITCCVYPACLCGRVCCLTRSTLSTLEVDMALLSVSRLTCGTWSLEWNIVLTLSLLTQHTLYPLCWWVVHVSDQRCFFIQHRVAVRVTPMHLQCEVCDSGNSCFSPSHCMTDCAGVLFYRQWTMRSWKRWKRHLKETRHSKS